MYRLSRLIHYNPILLNNESLLIAVSLLVCSIFLFAFRKNRAAIFVLFLGSLALNFCCIHLDPFLNSWDERFHALVAKNLTLFPFKPMLYVSPLLPYNFNNWTGNHVWLHKQPWFLWQMALAIKLFGVNEWSIRIPSALLGALLCIVICRMGTLLVNQRVGYIAALLYVSNNFILEHITGKQTVDHNDFAFMVYVTLSIWAWLEFEKSGKRAWLIGMALFSGIAILNKWLPGLLVFAGFGFYHLVIKRNMFKRETLVNAAIYLLLVTIVALPWQIYILSKFPVEAGIEYHYNSRHFFEVLDGAGGTRWYYISILKDCYSSLQFLIIPGLLLAWIYRRKWYMLPPVIFTIIFLYSFFTLAKTKMPSFVMPVAPLVFILIAITIDWFLAKLLKYRWLYPAITSACLFFLLFQNFDADKLACNHWRNPASYWGRFLENTAHNTAIYKSLDNVVPANCVIAYCNQFEEIDCMYFSGITAYSFLDEKNFRQLKEANKKIAVFNNNLPNYVVTDSSVFIIPVHYRHNPSPL